MSNRIHKLLRVLVPAGAICVLLFSMGGTWSTARVIAAPITSPTASPSGSGSGSSSAGSGTAGSGSAGSGNAGPGTSPSAPTNPKLQKNQKYELEGKLNLNTATEDQLMLLPTVGPSKAERIVTWRKKNGGFKRSADLRRVKGFGYRTFKRLEPFLDVKGDTTLAAKH